MSLSEQLNAELVEICTDERAWVPLRRGFVDELVAYLLAAEQMQAAAVAMAGWASKTPVPVEKVDNGEHLPKKLVKPNVLDDDAMRARAIAELQRLAKAGVAPSHAEFKARKQDASLPTLSTILYRLNTTLKALCEEAGLQPAGMGRPRNTKERAPALHPVSLDFGALRTQRVPGSGAASVSDLTFGVLRQAQDPLGELVEPSLAVEERAVEGGEGIESKPSPPEGTRLRSKPVMLNGHHAA